MPRLLVLPLGFAAVLLAVVGASAYFGAFNVAADAPHSGLTSKALALMRDRSIAARAADLTVPNLANRVLIATGAEHYSAMCTSCHLAPGMTAAWLQAPKPLAEQALGEEGAAALDAVDAALGQRLAKLGIAG